MTMIADLLRCGRSLDPHGDTDHHLKPPDPDPNLNKTLPPPFSLSSALPSMNMDQDRFTVIDDPVSRASTPSID